ncbi:hypothetical protein D2N39_18340 [Gemmobacter lutimaris]|uniref:Peptidase M10 serralysin C-terminal domain-containing protein n=2 Tax=Gemmobacter lutimaris TaxID=2306023 RepID=A0A398BIE5_9RHOB|nr:hypothetical protein D2N39_18340 [Gemmobacter lutimaris]
MASEAGTVFWQLTPTHPGLVAADFTGGVLPSGSVNFAAYGANSIQVTFQIADDALIEPIETFTLQLTGISDPFGGPTQQLGTSTLNGSITDGDTGTALVSVFNTSAKTQLLYSTGLGPNPFGLAMQNTQAGNAVVVNAPATLGNVGTHNVIRDNLTVEANGPFEADFVLGAGVSLFTMTGTAAMDATGNAATVFGNNGANALTGGAGANTLNGLGADDTLTGNGGNDILRGGDGNDLLIGGTGNDTLNGGAGFGDTADYSAEAARVVVELGIVGVGQLVSATAGTDTLVDIENVRGGAGNDRIVGSTANNVLAGNAGADNLFGVDGSDVLYGGDSNDGLYGGAGNDQIFGMNDNDRLFGGAGNDTLDGGAGVDFADYRPAAGTGVNVNLSIAGSQLVSASEGFDTLVNIENLSGSGFGDTLTGNAGDNVIYGIEGNDTISGGGGVDRLIGGLGQDTLTGGAGADVFFFTRVADSDLISGRDTITDFVSGTDKLNLAQIDANTGVAGDQAFTFLGTGAFTGVAGQLRLAVSGANSFLLGDTDGNGTADLNVALLGVTSIVAGDIIL